MSLIKVENITKRFDDKLVLDNISFEIEEGDIFGLIGPNGAGKSTLINIMTGILDPMCGEVSMGGFSINKNPLEVKKLIGLVPQEIALMESYTAYENLEFFGVLYGLKGKELQKRIDEILEVIGLKENKKEFVKKFSGGMKRRLNIGAAILHNPRILIMDEPTVGIDAQSRNYIFEFTKKLNRENKTTIIYTSHYMEEVEHLCKNIFIMDVGKEIAYGNKSSIKNMMSDNNRLILVLDNTDREIILSIKEFEGVQGLTEDNEELTIMVDKNNFKLGLFVNMIENHGKNVRKVSFEESSLEEIFLSLTGKTLRD